jgi:regulatory protein
MVHGIAKTPPRQGTRPRLRENPRYVATRLLAVRPRTVAELRRRLQGKGFDKNAVDAVLQEFHTRGLLDDRAFARQRAEAILARTPVGRRLLSRRLRAHGVPPAIITETLAAVLPVERERELAQRAMGEHLRTLERRGIPRARRFDKTARHLLARGFPPDVITELADTLR